MAGRDYTTVGLLASIKRKAFLPDSNGPFTDDELLTLADDSLDERIVPAILAEREEYLLLSEDVPIVANQQKYRIPENAVGGVIRLITYLDSNGNGGSMAWKPVRDIDLYAGSAYAAGYPPAFAIEGDDLVLLPAPTGAVGTLRFRVYQRPGKLVHQDANADNEYGTITAIAGAEYTCDYIPTGWGATTKLDFVDSEPNFATLSREQTGTIVTGSSGTVTLATALTGVAVGDYIAQTGEAPVAQVPADLHPILARAVAAEALSYVSDPRSGIAAQMFEHALAKAIGSLTPRVHGESKRTINWSSPLRSANTRSGRW